MTQKRSHPSPVEATPAQPLVDLLLEVERPSSEELAPYSRGERYRRLRANTEAHRGELEAWIAHHQLSDEVRTVSPATGFNLLFVQCTPHAARELAHAPGVIDILSSATAATNAVANHGA
jgi:hypothetical protein